MAEGHPVAPTTKPSKSKPRQPEEPLFSRASTENRRQQVQSAPPLQQPKPSEVASSTSGHDDPVGRLSPKKSKSLVTVSEADTEYMEIDPTPWLAMHEESEEQPEIPTPLTTPRPPNLAPQPTIVLSPSPSLPSSVKVSTDYQNKSWRSRGQPQSIAGTARRKTRLDHLLSSSQPQRQPGKAMATIKRRPRTISIYPRGKAREVEKEIDQTQEFFQIIKLQPEKRISSAEVSYHIANHSNFILHTLYFTSAENQF